MRNLSKLHYLFFALLMFAMTGCGANNTGGTASTGTPGSIAANMVWKSGTGKTAKTLASIPTGIANGGHIQFVVTGTGANGAIPVVRSTIAGSSTTGTVSGIYPGTVAVSVTATDSTGAVLYEGYAVNVTVASDATTNVGTIYMSAPIVKTEEVPCLGCHETALDATGQNIIANYKQSGHYINTTFTDANGVTPGCVGCHGPSHNNPDPSENGTASRCFECHNKNGVAATLTANHSSWYLVNGTACAACHQVHNTALANMERKSWAQSAHGDTAFPNMDFSHGGTCAWRCHNGKSFAASLANPTAVTATLISQPAQQMVTCDSCHTNAPLGKLRVLAGTSASPFAFYSTLQLAQGFGFAANNNINTQNGKKGYYPDVAGSNLCIVCHSGTVDSATAPSRYKSSDPAFTQYTSALMTQHNMPAAAVMYMKFGFQNLSTGAAGVPSAAYLASLTSDIDSPNPNRSTGGYITSTHRKLGTSAIHGDSHNPTKFVNGYLDYNGPCATCHVAGSHSFKIDQAAINAVCSNCHTSENGNDISTQSAFETFFLDPQKEVYNNAIALGLTIVNKQIEAYNAANPSTRLIASFRVNSPTATGQSSQPYKVVFANLSGSLATSGTSIGNYNAARTPIDVVARALISFKTGQTVNHGDLAERKFIGAIGNLAFFAKDQGGFAHARSYSRKLIYDSIDFLDDYVLNMSAGATATSTAINGTQTILGFTNPVYNLYSKGANAYNTNIAGTAITSPYSGTSESMLYLLGWNRTTGKWNGTTAATYNGQRP